MRKCEDCNIILDEAVRFCPKCGKEVAAADGTNRMPRLEVGAYLTSANLHRIRKEWDEAVADATEALRIDPNNADIASLLGIIYQERGMLEDAVIWFQMALEMNPGAVSDRAKLKQVKKQIAQGSAGTESHDRFKIFEKQTRVWAIALAAIFITVITLALILALGKHDREDIAAGVAGGPRIEASDVRKSAAPPIVSPSMTNREPVQSQVAAPQSSATGSAVRTPAEIKINQDVSGSQGIGPAKIDDVIADPRQSIAIVTFSIPASSCSKSTILTTSGAVARAAFVANSEVKTVTARCVVTLGSASSTQIAFVGDIPRRASEILGANPTTEQIEASFTGVWWNPQIK